MELVRFLDFEKFYMIDCFDNEFKKVTDNSTYYRKWLIRELHVLENEGKNAIKFRRKFELLHNEKENLYSMMFKPSEINLRIIYTMDEDDAVLLVPFKEKSRSDYENAKEKAKKRIKALIS